MSRLLPAPVCEGPEHIPAPHRVKVRIAPEGIVDHCPIKRILNPEPPREPVRIRGRRIELNAGLMELVAPEP